MSLIPRRALLSFCGFVAAAQVASAQPRAGIVRPCAVCGSVSFEELGHVVGGHTAVDSELSRIVVRRDRPLQMCLVCWTLRVMLRSA